MTEIMENGMDLRSDPLADEILEIVNGATKYRVSFKNFLFTIHRYIFYQPYKYFYFP